MIFVFQMDALKVVLKRWNDEYVINPIVSVDSAVPSAEQLATIEEFKKKGWCNPDDYEKERCMDNTLEYYNKNANQFVQGTLSVDFRQTQNRFLSKLPAGAHILDFGCGSGRDAKYFLENGCQVDATDGSEELSKIASDYIGIDVKCMLFEELADVQKYEGIWACSSVLHLSKGALSDVLKKMAVAVKDSGVIYTSFKYGNYEGERNGRYFTDFTLETFEEYLQKVPELQLEEYWITGDVRLGRGEEKWLNLILRKSDIH